MSDSIHGRYWGRQLEALMAEVVREAAICRVQLLDPGVVEAVLQDNPSVCGNDNPAAFKKLRELLMLGFVVREKAVEHLGPLETEALARDIREKLAAKYAGIFGDRLGGAGTPS